MTQLGPLTDADTDWSDAARIATRLFLLTRALGDWKGLTYDQVTGLRREQERDLDSQPQAGALKNLRADWLAASAFASRCGQQDLFADIRPSETDIVDNIDALDKVMKTLLSRLNTTATRAQNAEIHRQEDTKHSHTAEEEDTCCSGALDDISVLGDDDVLPVPDTPGPLPISPSPCLAADATHTPTPSSDGEDDSMYHEGALLAGDDGGQIRKLRAAIQERVPNLSELTEDQRKELYKDGGWDDALRAAACFVELSHMVNATKDPTRTIQHFHVLRPDDYSAEQSDALADIQWAGLVAAVNHRAEATGFAKDNFVLSDDGASLFEVERLTEHVNRVWAKQESSVSKHDSREIEQGPVLGTSMLPHDTEEDRRLWERAFDEAKRTKYDNMTARAVCTSPVAETDENSQSNLHASGSTNDTGSYIGSALFAVGAMSVVGYLGRAAYNALTGGDEDR
ncbi:uncharacterized protein MKK02DRAFT_44589 [Dioszegia hungarica]|uniref:Uncharacterized protein n=1 Tax=Dioszegia hungarica TaxID=4972 RepID=A0AA38HB24_9TREE|nr:uncharacterized protein MKK02DRAFT_44589 [Dioszegia hungarica]KAI9635891.1 hypothetical protein MKK02DRAFT_44589 [Dioszegia hungarica]